MNQHFLQKSWLKQFKSAQGKVEVISIDTLISEPLSPDDIAYEPDFQSAENEMEDQRIESRAIRTLHRLKKGLHPVTNAERGAIEEWVALHLARSPKSRESLRTPVVSYDRARSIFISTDLTSVQSYRQAWTYQADTSDEPLILSDNPILRMSDAAILFPFSPRTLVVLSNHDPRYAQIERRSWTEVVNEMSFANATVQVYGNPDTKPPWKEIRERSQQNVRIEIRESSVRVM